MPLTLCCEAVCSEWLKVEVQSARVSKSPTSQFSDKKATSNRNNIYTTSHPGGQGELFTEQGRWSSLRCQQPWLQSHPLCERKIRRQNKSDKLSFKRVILRRQILTHQLGEFSSRKIWMVFASFNQICQRTVPEYRKIQTSFLKKKILFLKVNKSTLGKFKNK